MTPEPQAPDDEQKRLAVMRAVRREQAEEIIRSVITAACESIRQLGSARLGDGGAMRSVPLDAEGFVEVGSPVHRAFLSDGEALAQSAEEFEKWVMGWEEVEKFSEAE